MFEELALKSQLQNQVFKKMGTLAKNTVKSDISFFASIGRAAHKLEMISTKE